MKTTPISPAREGVVRDYLSILSLLCRSSHIRISVIVMLRSSEQDDVRSR